MRRPNQWPSGDPEARPALSIRFPRRRHPSTFGRRSTGHRSRCGEEGMWRHCTSPHRTSPMQHPVGPSPRHPIGPSPHCQQPDGRQTNCRKIARRRIGRWRMSGGQTDRGRLDGEQTGGSERVCLGHGLAARRCTLRSDAARCHAVGYRAAGHRAAGHGARRPCEPGQRCSGQPYSRRQYWAARERSVTSLRRSGHKRW